MNNHCQLINEIIKDKYKLDVSNYSFESVFSLGEKKIICYALTSTSGWFEEEILYCIEDFNLEGNEFKTLGVKLIDELLGKSIDIKLEDYTFLCSKNLPNNFNEYQKAYNEVVTILNNTEIEEKMFYFREHIISSERNLFDISTTHFEPLQAINVSKLISNLKKSNIKLNINEKIIKKDLSK